MPDQIFTPGPQDTPLSYLVPGTGEITPLACQALYDGTNASGDFVPTLIFKSQAGHVISRVPTSTTVAAGNSAEVTWAPFLRGAAPSTGGFATQSGVFTTGGNFNTVVGTFSPTWTALQTNAPGQYSIPGGSGQDGQIPGPGFYSVSVSLITGTQPQQIVGDLTAGVTGFDTTPILFSAYVANMIDVHGGGAGDPMRVTEPSGFCFMDVPAGLTPPLVVRMLIRATAVFTCASAQLSLTRLSATDVT